MRDDAKHSAQKDIRKAEHKARRPESRHALGGHTRSGYVQNRSDRLIEIEKPLRMGVDGEQVLHVAMDVRTPPELVIPAHPSPVVHALPDINDVQARKRHIVRPGTLYKAARRTSNRKPGKTTRYLATQVKTCDPHLVICR